MNYSKQYLSELSAKTNFLKDNLEKILRLSEILNFLNTDNVFKGKLALKGGTAINLTAIELPRLSVDIDLDFTENLPKEYINEIKGQFTKRLTDYMWQEGYSLMVSPREHYALLSFTFNYVNNAGNRDNIKIEINFMDRCHILPLEQKQTLTNGVTNKIEILTLNTIELYASKINALLSRATPRDLYDVNAMIEKNIVKDKNLLRKCLIFYNMSGGEQDIDNLTYGNIEKINYMKFKTQLKPVISKTDKFDLDKAKLKVVNYLKELINLTQKEECFITEFKKQNYEPELLFEDKNIIENILFHPMALWRCRKQ